MNPAELFRQEDHPVRLMAGETLFRAGETGREMFVLLDGAVDIVIGETALELAQPGALIGEMALIDPAPRAATVIAKTNSVLARIDQRRFHFLIQQNPFFATHVMKILVERLRHMNERLAPPPVRV